MPTSITYLTIMILIPSPAFFFFGDFKTYLQSMNVRIEEWRVKRRDIEEWMKHRQLPQDLQDRVLQFNQYKWLATRGVNEEFILHSLPLDLRRAIQRHLCLGLVRRVSTTFRFYIPSMSQLTSVTNPFQTSCISYSAVTVNVLKLVACLYSCPHRYLSSLKWMINFWMQYVGV